MNYLKSLLPVYLVLLCSCVTKPRPIPAEVEGDSPYWNYFVNYYSDSLFFYMKTEACTFGDKKTTQYLETIREDVSKFIMSDVTQQEFLTDVVTTTQNIQPKGE